jgi:hypothetical protein
MRGEIGPEGEVIYFFGLVIEPVAGFGGKAGFALNDLCVEI